MTAETRREFGLNMMIGGGAVGGAAVGSPLGTALGMMAAGAQAPWGRLLVIAAIAVPIALTVWLIGRAVWARAWRDVRRERGESVGGNTPSDALCGDLTEFPCCPGGSGRVDETGGSE